MVTHLVPGPGSHGVTRHALGLLSRSPLAHHHVLRHDGTAASARAWLGGSLPEDWLHLHLTDHLLAPTAGECAEVVADLAARRPLSLSLHDLAQPADGPGRHERRRRAHATMASRARGVVVASEHERRLLQQALDAEGLTSGGPLEVVPLPLHATSRPAEPERRTPPRIAVFGYVFPDKGHADALEALADVPGAEFHVLGAPSPGHDEVVADLLRRGRELGRRVQVHGYVPENAVDALLRSVEVPLAPRVHVSASGSIGSWLAAGRRPLVPTGAYVDELEARCPGALLRYGPGTDLPDLTAAIRAACSKPELTWLDGIEIGPDEVDCARRTATVLDAWAAAS